MSLRRKSEHCIWLLWQDFTGTGDVQGILYIHSTVKGFNVAGENEAVVARVVKAITDLGSHRDEFAKQILRQSRPSDSTNLDLHSFISAADQISTPAYTGESGLR